MKRIYFLRAPDHTLFSIDGFPYCVKDTHPYFEGINTELSAFDLLPEQEVDSRFIDRIIQNIDDLLNDSDEVLAEGESVFEHPETARIADIDASVDEELDDYEDYENRHQCGLDKQNRTLGYFEE